MRQFARVILLVGYLFLLAGSLQAQTQVPPLFQAVLQGRLDQVTLLLDQGADISAMYEQSGIVAYAVLHGRRVEIIKLLLARGANPKVPCLRASAPWWLVWQMDTKHSSIEAADSSLMSLLLHAGVSPDAIGDETAERKSRLPSENEYANYQTPLMLAAGRGSMAMVQVLVAAGADTHRRSPTGLTAADFAKRAGFVLVADWLEGKDSTVYKTSLRYAVETGNYTRMRELIAAGADVNVPHLESQQTPLHVAARQGDVQAARLLLAAGATIDPRDTAHMTPLLQAVSWQRNEVALLLVAQGADPNATMVSGCAAGSTAFYLALEFSNHALAELMLEHGAHVPKYSGQFRRYTGYREADVQLVRKLLAHGMHPLINIFQRFFDEGSRTYRYRCEVATLLLEAAPQLATWQNHDHNDRTPLHEAAFYGDSDMATVLLKYGADPGAVDRDGKTPLQVARATQHEAVERLLQAAPRPPRVPEPEVVLTADEIQGVALLNADRAANHLPALTVEPHLVKVARAHATDMATRDFVDHTNPDGESPYDRLNAAYIPFRGAAENLAKNGSIMAAEKAFMLSQGHRTNILDPTFTHVGLGVVKAKNGQLLVVQVFIKE